MSVAAVGAAHAPLCNVDTATVPTSAPARKLTITGQIARHRLRSSARSDAEPCLVAMFSSTIVTDTLFAVKAHVVAA